MADRQTVICMKWGTRYGVDYVNRLASMVFRNAKRPTRFVCFTDDSTGMDPRVEPLPLPAINLPERFKWSVWRKLSLWQAPLADLTGDVLFIDLDVVITGLIDDFFDFEPGRYCVAENWTEPGNGIGNTTVFRFPVGKFTHIFDRFNADPQAVMAQYRIEQQYISREVADMVFWPKGWCVSFKSNLVPWWPMRYWQVPRLPVGTKLVAFTGKPDPDEAMVGRWPERQAWKRLYKVVRPAPWIAEHWR